jgi:hypothetical protein
MSLDLLEKLIFVELVNKFPKVHNCVHKNPPQDIFLGHPHPIYASVSQIIGSLRALRLECSRVYLILLLLSLLGPDILLSTLLSSGFGFSLQSSELSNVYFRAQVTDVWENVMIPSSGRNILLSVLWS